MIRPLHLSDAQEEVGRRMAEFRHAEGMTMEEIGQVVDVTKSSVNQWEKGSQRVTLDHLFVFSRRYGLNPLYIMLLSGKMYDYSLRSRPGSNLL